MNQSFAIQKKPSIITILLLLLLSLTVGVLLPIFTGNLIFILIPILVLTIVIISNRLYDFFLIIHPLILIFAQYMSSTVLLVRWFSLLFLVVLPLFILRKQRLILNQASIGLILVGSYSIMTSIISYYPTVSFLRGVALLLLALFITFLPSVIQRLHPQIKPVQFVFGLYALIAIMIVLSNAVFFVLKPSSSFMTDRFRGWFVNPNGIGAIYGIFFLPILIYIFWQQKAGFVKLGFLFILLLAAIELIASGSRAGILAWIVSLLIFFLGQVRWSSRLKFVTLLGLFILILILANPQSPPIRNFLYRNEVVLTGSTRLTAWNNVWNKFLSKPIFGSGLGVDQTDAAATGLVFESVSFTTEKANSYLGMLQELGLSGTIIFIITLLVPIIKTFWKGFISKNSSINMDNLIIISIVAAGLTNVFFEGWLLSVGSDIGFSFWIFTSFLFDTSR